MLLDDIWKCPELHFLYKPGEQLEGYLHFVNRGSRDIMVKFTHKPKYTVVGGSKLVLPAYSVVDVKVLCAADASKSKPYFQDHFFCHFFEHPDSDFIDMDQDESSLRRLSRYDIPIRFKDPAATSIPSSSSSSGPSASPTASSPAPESLADNLFNFLSKTASRPSSRLERSTSIKESGSLFSESELRGKGVAELLDVIKEQNERVKLRDMLSSDLSQILQATTSSLIEATEGKERLEADLNNQIFLTARLREKLDDVEMLRMAAGRRWGAIAIRGPAGSNAASSPESEEGMNELEDYLRGLRENRDAAMKEAVQARAENAQLREQLQQLNSQLAELQAKTAEESSEQRGALEKEVLQLKKEKEEAKSEISQLKQDLDRVRSERSIAQNEVREARQKMNNSERDWKGRTMRLEQQLASMARANTSHASGATIAMSAQLLMARSEKEGLARQVEELTQQLQEASVAAPAASLGPSEREQQLEAEVVNLKSQLEQQEQQQQQREGQQARELEEAKAEVRQAEQKMQQMEKDVELLREEVEAARRHAEEAEPHGDGDLNRQLQDKDEEIQSINHRLNLIISENVRLKMSIKQQQQQQLHRSTSSAPFESPPTPNTEALRRAVREQEEQLSAMRVELAEVSTDRDQLRKRVQLLEEAESNARDVSALQADLQLFRAEVTRMKAQNEGNIQKHNGVKMRMKAEIDRLNERVEELTRELQQADAMPPGSLAPEEADVLRIELEAAERQLEAEVAEKNRILRQLREAEASRHSFSDMDNALRDAQDKVAVLTRQLVEERRLAQQELDEERRRVQRYLEESNAMHRQRQEDVNQIEGLKRSIEDSSERTESLRHQLAEATNFMNRVQEDVETPDRKKHGHVLRLRKKTSYRCSYCQGTGRDFAWKCNHCHDFVHPRCLVRGNHD